MNGFVEIHRTADWAEGESCLRVLRSHEIDVRVTGGGGESDECVGSQTMVILVEASKAEVAKKRLLEAKEDSQPKKKPERDPRGWACPRCETEIESGIYVCWKCQYNPAAC